jgi:hypothetical protein
MVQPTTYYSQISARAANFWRSSRLAGGLSFLRPAARFAVQVWNWFPLTPLGMAVVGITLLGVQLFGGRTNDRIVLVGSVAVVLLVAACAVVTLLSSLWLRLRPGKGPAQALKLSVDQTQATGVGMGWIGLNSLLRIDLSWDNLPNSLVKLERRGLSLAEVITPGTRGELKAVRRRFVVGDVFGLTRCIFLRTSSAQIRIEPTSNRSAPQVIAEQPIQGDQMASPDGKPLGDLLEIRRYVAGDPLKRVLWKTYARTGQLLVRSEERTRAATKKTLAYFVTGAGDEPTASVARGMLEAGSLGENFVLGADRSREVATSVPAAIDVLIQSKSAEAGPRSQLPEFLTRGKQEGAGSCVVFVPAQPGEWIDEVCRALADFRGKSYVVVAANDAAAAGAASSTWRSWLLAEPRANQPQDFLGEIQSKLTRCSAQVIVVPIAK